MNKITIEMIQSDKDALEKLENQLDKFIKHLAKKYHIKNHMQIHGELSGLMIELKDPKK